MCALISQVMSEGHEWGGVTVSHTSFSIFNRCKSTNSVILLTNTDSRSNALVILGTPN